MRCGRCNVWTSATKLCMSDEFGPCSMRPLGGYFTALSDKRVQSVFVHMFWSVLASLQAGH